MFMILDISFAQLTINNTRLIFDHNEKSSQSIMVTNEESGVPYLIQAWIEDKDRNKVMRPLAALPILQRLNAEQSKYIKVSLINANEELVQDRESLLYLNILGIPPVSENDLEDKISLVIQLTIKLFYRPKGLPKYKEMDWLKELTLKKNGNSLFLGNPTPYHIVIYGFSSSHDEERVVQDLVLKPFSDEEVNVVLKGNTPHIYIVNDNGSGQIIGYRCGVNNCKMILE